VSFDDTDSGPDSVGSGWDEAPASNSNLLNEVSLNSMVTFAPGNMASLGSAFAVGGAPDLEFKYAGPNDTVLRNGEVEYVSGAAGVAGDYNGNGVVDAADYLLWRKGGTLQNEGRTSGVIDQQDYRFWRARFGAAPGSESGFSLNGGAAAPEPAVFGLLAIGLFGMGCGGNVRSKELTRFPSLQFERVSFLPKSTGRSAQSNVTNARWSSFAKRL